MLFSSSGKGFILEGGCGLLEVKGISPFLKGLPGLPGVIIYILTPGNLGSPFWKGLQVWSSCNSILEEMVFHWKGLWATGSKGHQSFQKRTAWIERCYYIFMNKGPPMYSYCQLADHLHMLSWNSFCSPSQKDKRTDVDRSPIRDTCSAIQQLQNMIIFCTNYPYTQIFVIHM